MTKEEFIAAVKRAGRGEWAEELWTIYQSESARRDWTAADWTVYGALRMRALKGDNTRKREGKPAEHTYRSRNLKVGEFLKGLCRVKNEKGYQCMRPEGHIPADQHKF